MILSFPRVCMFFFLFSDLFKVIFVTLYHGESPLNHPPFLGDFLFYFFQQPSIQVDKISEKGDLSFSRYGCFQNRGTPKWMAKIMENPIKMDDLGVPLFLETPISLY